MPPEQGGARAQSVRTEARFYYCMIALIQRVTQASVRVDGRNIAAIEHGLLALIGIVRDDSQASAERLLRRLLDYRVFADANGRMGLCLRELRGGGLLLVPQFTLAADTARGNRASFSPAAEPALAERLFDHLLSRARATHEPVAAGQFGAHMQLSLVNDGPVTFWLQSSTG
jgi:D-tyrosyl-tRNA(Tyr) deacylase